MAFMADMLNEIILDKVKRQFEFYHMYSNRGDYILLIGGNGTSTTLSMLQLAMDRHFRRILPIRENHVNISKRKGGESFRQRLHHLISGANFVILDNSYPHTNNLELGYCKNTGVITAILLKEDAWRNKHSGADFDIHSDDFKIFSYNESDFSNTLHNVISNILSWVDCRKEIRESKLCNVS